MNFQVNGSDIPIAKGSEKKANLAQTKRSGAIGIGWSMNG
jgi:hypothetical protein